MENEVKQMIDREFSHQNFKTLLGNEYIQISKDYLVDMIVKQMEHASSISRADTLREVGEKINKYAIATMEAGAKDMDDVYIGKMNAIRDIESLLQDN